MAVEESIRAKMMKLRLLCEKEITSARERSGNLACSIRESIKSIKPLVENTLAKRGEVAKLIYHIKELETSFSETLKVNSSKKAMHITTHETISAMVVRIENLMRTVDDQREKKDKYEALLSQQLLALRKIEERNEEDMLETKRILDVTDWYKNILGFETEGGEGVKFSFHSIDPNDQVKEFWFVVRLDGDIYKLLDCNPQLDNVEELVEELNRTNGLFKFVRVMREKFKETTCKDSHSIAVLSTPPNSLANRTEMFNQDDQSWQSKKRYHGSLHKDVPNKVAILSPQSISKFRRSPRLMVKKLH